jgi:monoamine oxidase
VAGADVIVVGAGAAGIAAARYLHDAGLDVLLIEASGRLGGRAHSVRIDDLVLDLGCGWLHSAKRNPWTRLAGNYGLTVDRSPANWNRQWWDLGFPPDQHEAFDNAWARWESSARGALNGPDRALSDFIEPGDPWRPMMDAISGYANGAPLTAVSLHDWAAYDDASTDDNWAVREGYGTLVARHARDLAVEFDTKVSRIDHSGPKVRVETDRGLLETCQVILCVPTTALAGDGITFDPPLPNKHAAAAALPLGLADKLFLRSDGPALPRNGHLIGDPHKACTASYRLAPFGWPMIEGFFGGDCAEAFDDESDDAIADFAIGELVGLLGGDWRTRLTPIARTRWRHEAHIGGSYSHALVGAVGQRAVLAEPVDNRLFFAGEACSTTDFSTAHGAFESGIAAAEAVIAAGSGDRWTGGALPS